MNRLPIDQLNLLQKKIIEIVGNDATVEDTEEIIDSVEDLLIMAFVFAQDSATEDLGIESKLSTRDMGEILYRDVAGKTWTERITEYLQLGGSEAEINRVVDTEMMRVYNETKYEIALQSGEEVNKTWVTMADDRVRDTHWVLEGVTIPMSERFYTIDGDSALRPYGFENADNNIGCRCVLDFSRV